MSGRIEHLALRHVVSFSEAARIWRQLADRESEGPAGPRWRALVRLGEALRGLGDHEEAVAVLREALDLALASGDRDRIAATQGVLGGLLAGRGQTEEAARLLEAAHAGADRPEIRAAVAIELGNTLAARSEFESALAYYAEAARSSEERGANEVALRARANRAWLAAREAPVADALAALAAARSAAEPLPPSHAHALALIQLGRAAETLADRDSSRAEALRRDARALLSQASEMAEGMGDARAESWAVGHLAESHESDGDLETATILTGKALDLAERGGDRGAELLWRVQLGRFERARGNREAAIASLEAASEMLLVRRHAMAGATGLGETLQRARVSQVHIELVDLLLQRAAERSQPSARQSDLARAQAILERFKAAELRDYFRDECVDAYRERIRDPSQVSPSAAVVYPIVLPDRLELLVSGRDGIRQFSLPVPRDRLEAEVRRFRRLLEDRMTRQYRAPARRLHEWLIDPILPHLEALEIDTLVFVPGGILRTVPIAALHDGERFLVERYAVAISPGLELTDPRPLDREALRAFLGGVGNSVQGYPALAGAGEELRTVKSLVSGNLLFDDAFTTERVRSALRATEFSVVHFATHAEFGGRVEDSFLLTYDDRLDMDELAESVGAFRYRETPLELIVLSACETAAGDERAALGLAGLAVKSGARSAIGTFWLVNDEAASRVVVGFYRFLLDPALSRAEALRRSQRALIEDPDFAHPANWSPFVLISNWL